MITASEARKRATAVDNTTTAKLLTVIEKRIEDAVAGGKLAVNIEWLDNPNVKDALERKGYTVKNVDDPRERACWTTISW